MEMGNMEYQARGNTSTKLKCSRKKKKGPGIEDALGE
jgi:hypothetical protein